MKIVKETREKMPGKVVGVIGSTVGSLPYESYMGYYVGLMLAYTLGKENTALVGGVEGIGIDTYLGFAQAKVTGNFVVLPPETVVVGSGWESDGLEFRKYQLPVGYDKIQELSGCPYTKIAMGDDMDQRRAYLGHICDIVIVLHGGHGTADEADWMTKLDKPVIAFSPSGGVARKMVDKILGNEPPYRMKGEVSLPRGFNTKTVIPAFTFSDVEQQLEKLLQVETV